MAGAGCAVVLARRDEAVDRGGCVCAGVGTLAGATYARIVKPYAEENAYLRLRLEFVETLERRMLQLTPAERRQLDALLKGALPK